MGGYGSFESNARPGAPPVGCVVDFSLSLIYILFSISPNVGNYGCKDPERGSASEFTCVVRAPPSLSTPQRKDLNDMGTKTKLINRSSCYIVYILP